MRLHLILILFLFLLSCRNSNQTRNAVQDSQAVLPKTEQQDVKQNLPAVEKWETIFDGYIGEPMGNHYYIMIFLNRTSDDIYKGKYLYKSEGKYIKLEGKTIGNQLELTEQDEKGNITGKFTGILSESDTKIDGKWSKPDGSGQLNFYVNRIIPIGIGNPGKFDFAHLKPVKSENEKKVMVTGLPDSIQVKVNNLLNIKKESEMQKLNYEVLYNLNGILTIAYTQTKEDGWWSTEYFCINLRTGRLLRFDDIFKSESKNELQNLAIAKLKEECPDQMDFDNVKEFSTNNEKLEFPIVDNRGVSFVSPCERSSGYFLGVRLLSCTFEEIKPFLKME
jgi:hypothetical protein